jgi:hypothetical protein
MTGPQDVTDTGTEIVHTVHTVHTATSTADEAGSPRTPAGEQLVEVSFKGNRREFFRWTDGDAPALKTPVIVEVERGEDFGVIHATSELALQRKAGTAHGKASSVSPPRTTSRRPRICAPTMTTFGSARSKKFGPRGWR